MTSIRYVVLDEHTLGYFWEGGGNTMAVLAGKPWLGGHNPINGPVVVMSLNRVRNATQKDFDDFRCSSHNLFSKEQTS